MFEIFSRIKTPAMCVKSKVVWLLLLWSFLVYTGSYLSRDAIFFHMLRNDIHFLVPNTILLILFQGGFVAFIQLFLPLCGWVGDVWCGRYNTIKCSLLLLISLSIIPMVVSCANLIISKHSSLFMHSGAKAATLIAVILLAMAGICGYTAFLANIIPFAMDQLRDSPVNEVHLYIYWYIGIIISDLPVSLLVNKYLYAENTGTDTETSKIMAAVLTILLSIMIFVALMMCVEVQLPNVGKGSPLS
jgi:hypothetical protein